jgi:hypothetical protein
LVKTHDKQAQYYPETIRFWEMEEACMVCVLLVIIKILLLEKLEKYFFKIENKDSIWLAFKK